ncbi:MAG: RluA family pseudouridine synthase [Clostridiales bacterium]|jgi:23S rRNA pseudouridine1911/1915/1917 synthase|nr:RluA family pseudouridine synthase [Clostridiales bacterium]
MLRVVESGDVGARLDIFAAEFGGLTRNAVNKLIAAENVTVNGAKTKAGYRLRLGDKVHLRGPSVVALEIAPQALPLDIIYEDSELIVVNKPKGMVVHPAPGHAEGTLVNALLFHCGDSLSGINGVLRPGIVHRIDKDTSGLLVAAKTDRAHNALAKQFAERAILREYIAIVHGRPNPPDGTINAPLARHKINRKKMAVDPAGRAAITHYQTLESFGNFTLIQARLETGRTHQIRAHMAHIGHPVMADPVYSRAKQNFGLDGQALHAQTLGFTHTNGEKMRFEADPPPCFQKALNKIRP